MMNKEYKFKVGDWIIIREDILERINIGRVGDERYHFESPQKIVKTETYGERTQRNIYHIERIGNTRENLDNFRLATDKEIKEQIIKNVFLN